MVHNFDLPLACFARQRLVAMRVGGMVDVADFLQQSLCVSPGDGETVNVRNPPFNRDKKKSDLGMLGMLWASRRVAFSYEGKSGVVGSPG